MPCHTSLLNAHLERCHVITTHAKHHCICTAAQQSGRSRGYHTCGAARGHRKRVRGSMLYTWPPLYTSRSRGYHTCGAALAVAILPRTSTALYDIRGACGGHTATNQYYNTLARYHDCSLSTHTRARHRNTHTTPSHTTPAGSLAEMTRFRPWPTISPHPAPEPACFRTTTAPTGTCHTRHPCHLQRPAEPWRHSGRVARHRLRVGCDSASSSWCGHTQGTVGCDSARRVMLLVTGSVRIGCVSAPLCCGHASPRWRKKPRGGGEWETEGSGSDRGQRTCRRAHTRTRLRACAALLGGAHSPHPDVWRHGWRESVLLERSAHEATCCLLSPSAAAPAAPAPTDLSCYVIPPLLPRK